MKSKEQILKESLAADWGLPVSLVSLQMGQVSESVCYAAMQSYADQFKPKWISVEEWLPETEKQVSIRTAKNLIRPGYWHSDGYWIVQLLDSVYRGDGLHEVTHWMPLPEPPKTEK